MNHHFGTAMSCISLLTLVPALTHAHGLKVNTELKQNLWDESMLR